MTHDLTFCDSANSVFALMNLQQQHNYAIIFNGLFLVPLLLNQCLTSKVIPRDTCGIYVK